MRGHPGCALLLGLIALAAGSVLASPVSPAPGAPSMAAGKGRLDATDPHALKCGSMFCDVRSSYCETIKTDVAALPSNYTCKPLPASCKASDGKPAPTCGCFPPGTRGDMCSTVDRGGTPGFWRTTVGGR